MTMKEELLYEIDSFKESELEKLMEYVKFLKIRHILTPHKNNEEKDYASLYAEFEQDDRELAEQGVTEYAIHLHRED